MKQYIALFLIAAASMMHAVVVDKVTIQPGGKEGRVTFYSHGARHSVKTNDFGKSMTKAIKAHPHARWRSIHIGSKTYTLSHPTAQWTCHKTGTC